MFHVVPLLVIAAAFCQALVATAPAHAQAGLDDDRVMLQGFYWESPRHGHLSQFGTKHWYAIVQSVLPTIVDGRIDLIWLPPTAFAEDNSAGYDPRELFRVDNSYGTFKEHRALLVALLKKGVEPIADVVINHRNGSTGWADFKNPDWGPWSICANDEAFDTPDSGIAGTPKDQRGHCEETVPYRPGTTYAYPDFRDVAHTEKRVRDDVVRYLLQLRSLGYRGWRYDMVHGYGGQWIACYNAASKPTFAVGEYDWDKHNEQRGWIWATATDAGATGQARLKTASDVFDFTTFGQLKALNTGKYGDLYGSGGGIGMVSDTTDGLPWKSRAVTFVENHDTGYRTKMDGTPEENHFFDSFANNWQVEQAYAHVLTHPGLPTVYWKHYFDWGTDLQQKIKALISARKVAGIHAGSAIQLQNNARAAGVYAARIEGKNGVLYVRLGGNDASWEPGQSGYADFREYAQGAGWKVWVALPGNPPFKQAGHRAALPIPKYRDPGTITVPKEPLCQ